MRGADKRRLSRRSYRRPIWIRALVLGVIVVMVGFALDLILHSVHESWLHERTWENVIEGICAAIIAYFIILDREKRLQKRFREIAYLNHHVRNALSPIVMSHAIQMETRERIEMIRESTDRIQRCLERISREEDVGDYRDNPQKP